MQKSGDLKYTVIISILLHLLLLFILASVKIKGPAGKTVYLTEITFLSEMPYGKGLGQKGVPAEQPILENPPVKNPVIKVPAEKTKPVKVEPDPQAVKTVKVVPRSNEEILKLRKDNPIGIEPNEMRNSIDPSVGPVFGGGIGDDALLPGSLDGNPNIEGPLQTRGIRFRAEAQYPEWARSKGIEGEVKVQIKVDPNGDVGYIIVIRTCGFKELDHVVTECMKKWKFDSLPISANQVGQDGVITFKFNLKK